MTSMVGNYSSKHDVWNDTSSCLEWSMVVERVVRFGEGTFVIGTCKKPSWTLMMSCGTWNERESKCVLSMRVVSFFEWGRVLYYTGHRYLPCRYWWLWCLDSVGGQDTSEQNVPRKRSRCLHQTEGLVSIHYHIHTIALLICVGLLLVREFARAVPEGLQSILAIHK